MEIGRGGGVAGSASYGWLYYVNVPLFILKTGPGDYEYFSF